MTGKAGDNQHTVGNIVTDRMTGNSRAYTLDRLKREAPALIKDDPEVLAMWREAVTNPEGGDKRSEAYITNYNVISDKAQQGNSRAYTLDRLKREAPC